MSKPIISVCVGTYNRAKWLREAVASVVAEGDTAYEVVVTDDLSADGTEEVIREFGACNHPVRYFRNTERLGFPQNFNKALALAKGEWLVPLADDDTVVPGSFRTVRAMMEALGEPGVIYSAPGTSGEAFSYRRFAAGTALLAFNGALPGSVYFSREVYAALGGYDATYLAPDEELFARYLSAYPAVQVSGVSFVNYRLHRDNLGLSLWSRDDLWSEYDRVSRQIATYRGDPPAATEAFVRRRRMTGARFVISRGLQCADKKIIACGVSVMREAYPPSRPLCWLLTRMPGIAITLYPVVKRLEDLPLAARLVHLLFPVARQKRT